jgi:hypothetical protein
MSGFLNCPDQTGHFKFNKPVSGLCASKEFTKKYNRLNFDAVTFESIIEKTVIIVLHVINYDAESVIFKRVDVDVKAARYVKMVYIPRVIKRFLNEIEAVEFVLSNIFKKGLYGVNLARHARFKACIK